eukprot:symbB.v1.2.014211.t2/scaffold1027.1/size171366/13
MFHFSPPSKASPFPTRGSRDTETYTTRRLLAEAALEQLEFSVAEKAFVRFEDYQGIQLVKRLRLLDDRVKQKAEVAAYFQRFDEAESLYREIDRKDLAIDLRVRLGDWFRVIQLAHGANEDLLHQAWSAIGDYYADRCKWHNAANYYAKAGNNAALVDTYYFLEDYDALERVIPSLPEGSPLLTEVGNKFASVGLCEQAVQAFLRHGDVKTAVDTCVLLNQWELAVNLAQQHNFQQIEGLLAKYAQHLLDKNKKIEAVQLYRKASRHTEAAKLLNQMAKDMPDFCIMQSAITFGSMVNWPPFDINDPTRPSGPRVQGLCRRLGYQEDEAFGPFPGLPKAVPFSITSPNGTVRGIRVTPTKISHRVLYLHGQGGNVGVLHRCWLYDVLVEDPLCCEVIAIDYCGCGYSDFCHPSEATAVADVLATLEQSGSPSEEVILWGHSLGTGIALSALTKLLQNGQSCKGLVLEAPFLSLPFAAASLVTPQRWPDFRQGLSKRLSTLMGHLQFNSASNILQVAEKMPVIILHGEQDNKVPFEQGQRLSEIGLVPLRSFMCSHNDIAKQAELGGAQRHPDRIKRLYLLAALEVEKFKNKTLDAQMTSATQGTMTTAQTLQSLVTQDQSVSSDRALESPWRGCEAFHIYLLAQRQLYEGQNEQAMKTSLRLAEYEDILDTQTIYSLIALTTYYNKFFAQCSRAFIKLEASSDVSDEMRNKFADLALSIFTRNAPRDPQGHMLPCPKCGTRINDWVINCP